MRGVHGGGYAAGVRAAGLCAGARISEMRGVSFMVRFGMLIFLCFCIFRRVEGAIDILHFQNGYASVSNIGSGIVAVTDGQLRVSEHAQ